MIICKAYNNNTFGSTYCNIYIYNYRFHNIKNTYDYNIDNIMWAQ